MQTKVTLVLILFFLVTITVLAQRRNRDTSPKIPEGTLCNRAYTATSV